MVGSTLKLSFVVFTTILCGLASAEPVSTSVIEVTTGAHTRNWSGDWKFGIGSSGYNQGNDEGTAAEFRLTARFDYEFTKWLKAHVVPRAEFFSARLQERDDADDAGPSRIRLLDAYLNLSPVKFVEVHSGAIGQDKLKMPLLISPRRAFPGARELVVVSVGPEVKIMAMAQQLVPTSISFNSDREEKEKLPGFQTQSLHVEGKHRLAEWEAIGGHYRWNEIPSRVVFESCKTGNIANCDNEKSARFPHGMEGYFWGAEASLGPKKYPQPLLGWRGQTNSKAPDSAGDAESWSVGAVYEVNDIEYRAEYLKWYSEPNTTVSAYTQTRYGQTNRDGNGVAFKVDFKERGFSVVGEWYNARRINFNPSQDTLNAYSLTVETNYAPF